MATGAHYRFNHCLQMAKCLKTILTLSFLFNVLILHRAESFCTPDHAENATNNASEIIALKRIAVLQGVTWDWDSFALGVCPLELNSLKLAGAVQKTGKVGAVVLGRTNRTHAASGDNWVLLAYRGGDNGSAAPCVGSNFSTEILFICDTQETHEGSPRLVEQDACLFRFEIKTSALCEAQGPSAFTLIVVWTVFIFSLYCLVGIVYRRYKLRARGRQQIPHFEFWSKIGLNCANCCNWACRCEEEMISTWDDETDRDDTLLRP